MSEDERPEFKSTIHGHPVYCDDEVARNYLRKLDGDEADVLFSHAKVHGDSEFEISRNGSRLNYSMEYDDGAYIVTAEGREGGNSWI